MSVVQISRIQQRRGKKNSDFGFPQLASGELGWAIDTQELYIGNGAVSEGAPYVGNSKIITEHDDILQFVALYEYQKNNNHYIQTGESDGIPTKRSIQDRLDDIISVRSFGVIGDGIHDDTIALQRAIDQLFLNSNSKTNTSSRVVLYLEPGDYKISGEIRIPPFAHIVGAGIDSTIITQVVPPVTTPVTPTPISVFRMVANNSDPEAVLPYSNFGSMEATERPRNILISGLTLKTNNSNRIVYLDNTDSSLFDRVKFIGNYTNLTTTPTSSQNGIEARGTSDIFRSYNILFNFCIFNNIGCGFFSNTNHDNISFDHCNFYQLHDAIDIGGGSLGALNTNITNCYFDQVVRYGIHVKKGYGNISSNNKFMKVGNDNEDYGNATYPIIKFDTDNNLSKDDYFHRNTELKDQARYPYIPFITSIQSSGLIYDNSSFHKALPTTLGSAIVFLRLPIANSGTYIIDYVIKKNNRTTDSSDISGTSGLRSGTLTVIIDTTNVLSTLKDEYNYTGHSSIEDIVFSVALHNYVAGDPYPPTAPLDTLTINIVNPRYNGVGTMNYTYRMLSQ